MTVGVVNAPSAPLDLRSRTPAIKVITTNSNPVSVAAAEPMMV